MTTGRINQVSLLRGRGCNAARDRTPKRADPGRTAGHTRQDTDTSRQSERVFLSTALGPSNNRHNFLLRFQTVSTVQRSERVRRTENEDQTGIIRGRRGHQPFKVPTGTRLPGPQSARQIAGRPANAAPLPIGELQRRERPPAQATRPLLLSFLFHFHLPH